MELALIVFFIVMCAVVLAIVTIPLLAISKLLRVLKNSFRKLFYTKPKKA